ncbi:MAG: helix-turn-helix transcriptional regulator [Halioglobus sp.]|jgi:DNA-binding CsgD family transcriptional regulator/PAS domain-containing protein|uniref:Helix-turn-helix transcriptional regulator n=1 Tax=Candidatus Seongchinamella marina TaxID=2518990 RepID=A0ABT3SWP7_9GAMM|nr:helix-turn-helix transcriptional regulator [Candidatus Seongchinamella marina]EEB78997.1 transcriptional regulator, LuxR family protein [marine gamma proteobacterium HTCC2148]MCX2974427.1 helix-turn-helix transcriptional regulator [Candidatus Seongchinamella marina]MDG1388391.1 helix-turn-helix transcriptional regulator [Halioglobus sp.]MDG2325384.1 helix-turn-helix transcriptional regulator [Halioglobus sp.]
MTAGSPDLSYDDLLGLIYEGPLEDRPWQSALPQLRKMLDAQVASLVVRPPSDEDQGAILNSVRPEPGDTDDTLADPNAWQAASYQEEFFSLDPFVNLPLDKVVALEDVLSDKELEESDYYRHYLQPVGLFHILGVDTAEPGGMLARLRFSRRSDEPRFNAEERRLLEHIAPHLRRAIQIYATISRRTSERDIYAGAVSQLAVASIILDEQARVLSANPVAQVLLEQGDGLSLKGQWLHIEGRDINKELQQAVANIIRAQHQGEPSVVRALRVPRSSGRSDLGLVVRPVPVSKWSEGQSSPSAAIFISDPDLHESASRQTLAELFELTPAEANLAILLARGLSLAEVSDTQNVSQHTARAQLKSIFAKTGVSRQAELVRLVIKSVASLG